MHAATPCVMLAASMQMRIFTAAAILVAVLGFLGFRIVDLEQRVAALSRQLDGSKSSDADHDGTDAGVSGVGYEPRLAALEKRVEGIKANMHSLEKAAGVGISLPPGPHADKQILSVIERENNRVRDVQLEWSRARWLDTRQEQLTSFASQNKLSTTQTAELQKTLEHEVDTMVEVLRRPNLMEDPDSASSDWQALLDATDQAAAKVLTPEQLSNWNLARAIERKLLWPWLPSNMNK